MKASLPARSLLLLPLLVSAALAQDLPKRDATETFDFEPKLMLNDLPDLPLPAGSTAAPGTPSVDVAKLEAELDRARKNAAWRARLCKSGVLSKVEAEQGALKVLRLSRDLEQARLQAATQDIEEKRKQAAAGALSPEALAVVEKEFATLTTTARDAAAQWDAAQRAAAELRLQREKKLLAVGAGSRSAVKRAEAALQSLAPSLNP